MRKAVGVTVRIAQPHDAHELLGIYGPIVRDTAISFELDVPAVEEFTQRIVHGSVERPWLVAEREGAVVGYAYGAAFRARLAYRWSVEVSVYVAEAARGHGVGRKLYRALLGVLRTQGYAMAFAGIALPNPASITLHEHLGFQPVGIFHRAGFKFNAWHDVGWWELPLAETPPAAPPVPFSRFDRTALEQLLGAVQDVEDTG